MYVFVFERGTPLAVAGYQRIVARLGKDAGFPFLIHSHMMRHSCGEELANDGVDTRTIRGCLGHRSIVSTQRSTRARGERRRQCTKGEDAANQRERVERLTRDGHDTTDAKTTLDIFARTLDLFQSDLRRILADQWK
jgi:integrase